MLFTTNSQTEYETCKTPTQTNPEEKKSSLFIRPPKVLVVEDNEILQTVHRLLFISFGCQVDVAKDGFEAIALFSAGYDLILSDLELPPKNGMSKCGWDVTKEIRDYERHHNLPRNLIVALSTLDDSTMPKECLTAGFDAFYVKPFPFDRLPDFFKQWLPHLMQDTTKFNGLIT